MNLVDAEKLLRETFGKFLCDISEEQLTADQQSMVVMAMNHLQTAQMIVKLAAKKQTL